MKKRMDDIHSVNQENKECCINQNMAILNQSDDKAMTIMSFNASTNQFKQ